MKKYIKPKFMTILLNSQAILTGSDTAEGMLDGETGEQGAKSNSIWHWMGEEE